MRFRLKQLLDDLERETSGRSEVTTNFSGGDASKATIDLELWKQYCAICYNFARQIPFSVHERLYCTRISDAIAAHLSGNSALIEFPRCTENLLETGKRGIEHALIESIASQCTIVRSSHTAGSRELKCKVLLRRDIAEIAHKIWHDLPHTLDTSFVGLFIHFANSVAYDIDRDKNNVRDERQSRASTKCEKCDDGDEDDDDNDKNDDDDDDGDNGRNTGKRRREAAITYADILKNLTDALHANPDNVLKDIREIIRSVGETRDTCNQTCEDDVVRDGEDEELEESESRIADQRQLSSRDTDNAREIHIYVAWMLINIRKWLRSQCQQLPSSGSYLFSSSAQSSSIPRNATEEYDESFFYGQLWRSSATLVLNSANSFEETLYLLWKECDILRKVIKPLKALFKLGTSVSNYSSNLSASWVSQLAGTSLVTVEQNLAEYAERIDRIIRTRREEDSCASARPVTMTTTTIEMSREEEYKDEDEDENVNAKRCVDTTMQRISGDNSRVKSYSSQSLCVKPPLPVSDKRSFTTIANKVRFTEGLRFSDDEHGKLLAEQLDTIADDLRKLLRELVTDDALRQDALGLLRLLEEQAFADQEMQLVALLQQVKSAIESGDESDSNLRTMIYAKFRENSDFCAASASTTTPAKRSADALPTVSMKKVFPNFEFDASSGGSSDCGSADDVDDDFTLAIEEQQDIGGVRYEKEHNSETAMVANSGELVLPSENTGNEFTSAAAEKLAEIRNCRIVDENLLALEKERVTSLRQELISERNKIAQFERDLVHCRNLLSNCERRENDLSTELDATADIIRSYDRQLRLAEQATRAAKTAEDAVKINAAELTRKLSENEINLEECLSRVHQISAELSRCAKERTDFALSLADANSEYENVFAEHRNQIAKLHALLREKDADIENCNISIARHKSDVDTLGDKIDELEAIISSLKVQLNDAKAQACSWTSRKSINIASADASTNTDTRSQVLAKKVKARPKEVDNRVEKAAAAAKSLKRAVKFANRIWKKRATSSSSTAEKKQRKQSSGHADKLDSTFSGRKKTADNERRLDDELNVSHTSSRKRSVSLGSAKSDDAVDAAAKNSETKRKRSRKDYGEEEAENFDDGDTINLRDVIIGTLDALNESDTGDVHCKQPTAKNRNISERHLSLMRKFTNEADIEERKCTVSDRQQLANIVNILRKKIKRKTRAMTFFPRSETNDDDDDDDDILLRNFYKTDICVDHATRDDVSGTVSTSTINVEASGFATKSPSIWSIPLTYLFRQSNLDDYNENPNEENRDQRSDDDAFDALQMTEYFKKMKKLLTPKTNT